MAQRLILFSMLVLIGLPTQAKIFRNSYVSFEMSDNWKCNLEHTEWVCRSEEVNQSKEAVIILTAKEVGPTDTFEAYTAHLSTPQKTSFKAANSLTSTIKYAPKKVGINDHPWIDGLHLASEVPNYMTRYLATIKDRIAILVTYSAHKDLYTKYSTEFHKSVMSLRVIATKDLLNKGGSGLRGSGESLGGSIGAAMPTDLMGTEIGMGEVSSSGDGSTKSLFLGLAVVLAILGGYIFVKSRKG